MKKIDLEKMLRDYDYVKRVIENKSNKLDHSKAIHNLIVNFRKKWDSIDVSRYLYDLRDRWMALDERMLEEKLKKQKV